MVELYLQFDMFICLLLTVSLPFLFSGPNKKEDNNECKDLKKVKASVMKALENGLALR